MTKHAMAITPLARKIDAISGGSTTKNMIAPDAAASTLATIATTTLTVRSCPGTPATSR